MPTSPTLSAVIPSRNRLDRLPGLIRRYVDLGADQIVVALDGAHDGWREALGEAAELPGVTVVELVPHLGLALARTAALQHATGEVILVADDDVMPGDELIQRHRAFHAEHPRSALLGYMPVQLPARRGADQAATWIYATDYENQVAVWESGATPRQLLDSFWGGNASLPRELYDEAERFKPSERLLYNEDLDLGMRLARIGAGAAFDRRAAGAHLHQRSMAKFRAECVVRGEAVADLERRWAELPHQLVDLVRIPESHHPIAARLQAGVGARDTPGATESLLLLGYRVTGVLRIWRIQDAIARFLRRGLAIRGYRVAQANRG